MGNKRQAKASSEMAKHMKEMGIMRRSARCPINHRHSYNLKHAVQHFTGGNCK